MNGNDSVSPVSRLIASGHGGEIHTDAAVHALTDIFDTIDTVGTIGVPIRFRFTTGAHCAGRGVQWGKEERKEEKMKQWEEVYKCIEACESRTPNRKIKTTNKDSKV